jgi:molybdopterin-binding protein
VARYKIKQVAELLGVSTDTVRRWADTNRLSSTVESGNRRTFDGAELAKFAVEVAKEQSSPEPGVESARNRFLGIVTKVVKDKVMAQVDIQSGPHRFVSLISREAADELELAPGVLVHAVVKATNVGVEIPPSR